MRMVPSLHVTERASSGRYHSTPKTFTCTGSQYVASGSGPDGGAASAEDVHPLLNGQRGLRARRDFDYAFGVGVSV